MTRTSGGDDGAIFAQRSPARGGIISAIRLSRLAADHSQVIPPGPDGVGILPGEHTSDLRHVVQIVGDPGRQKLAERDRTKLRVEAAPFQVG